MQQAAMMENVLPLAAFGESARRIFADARRSGMKVVVEDDRPAGVLLSPDEYEKLIDEIEDMRVEQIAAERLSKPRGKGTSFEEALAEFGLTEKDLEGWEDVEIE